MVITESRQLALSSRARASDSSIFLISMLFSSDTTLSMDQLQLVIKILLLLPRGKSLATASRGGSSALSNTINQSSWIQDIHWRLDWTKVLNHLHQNLDSCAVDMLDISLKRYFIALSRGCINPEHIWETKATSEFGMIQAEDTYLSDISSMNLRQIWVFLIPSIPQRRQGCLGLLLVQSAKKKIQIYPVHLSIQWTMDWGLEFEYSCNLWTIIAKWFRFTQARTTHKSATSNE